MHLVKKLIAVSVLLSASVQAQNILEFPQPKNNPDEFYAVTEIPAGGIINMKPTLKPALSLPIVSSLCRWPIRRTTVL